MKFGDDTSTRPDRQTNWQMKIPAKMQILESEKLITLFSQVIIGNQCWFRKLHSLNLMLMIHQVLKPWTTGKQLYIYIFLNGDHALGNT